MTDQYTPPYHITPGILHSIEQIGEALGNLRLHSESIAIPILRAIEESVLTSDQESDHQSDQVMRLLLALRKSQRSATDLMTELGLSHRPTFRKNYLHPALKAGLLEMTQPGTPRARSQKYRLTARALQLLKKEET